MRRRQGLVRGTVVAAVCLTAAALPQAAEGRQPRDQHATDSAGPRLQTVLVTLRHQADLGRVTGTRRPARDRAVVRRLQAAAHQGQAPLVRRLRTWRAAGRVATYRRLWIVDAVSVTATPGVIRRLARRRDVASVAADAIDLVPSTTPVTPNLTTLRAPEVWSRGDQGAGVVVATLDTGADLTHPDLEPRWRGGADSWYDPYGQHPASPVDLNGHGTATLGAMVGGDASGTSIGVAPGARWIAARVFDDRGAATSTAVHLAFQWLLDPDHDPATADAPQVVNGSWSLGAGPSCDLTFQPDVQALSRAGILPVFAAGNYGPTPGSGVSPANYPESLAVGALADPTTVLASSSRGPSTCGGRTGTYPDVVAPGQDILTADRYGLYQVASGTSMAAPQVAGALALLLSAHPGLAPARQRDLLLSTTVDLGPPGVDGDVGYGRVDAVPAYDLATAPAPDFRVALAPTATAAAGTAVALTATVSPVDGFTGDVALGVTTPPGVTATVSPSVVTAGSGTATVSLAVAATTPPGTYPVTLRGTSGPVLHEASATLTVLPATLIELSLTGDAQPPGVSGTPDDADLFAWSGTTFRRTLDASASPYVLPTAAAVDGFSRLDASRFYVSFSSDVTLPGLGVVQDEDVVLWDGNAWRTWFDGTAHGLTASALDLDAISVVGGRLYFSTAGSTNPPGVRGTADDADVYAWDGATFTRVWDATANGLAAGVNVDGLDVTDPTHLAVSLSNATATVPGLGTVQDEDVLVRSPGLWQVGFDGTAAGLLTDAQDVDDFDLP